MTHFRVVPKLSRIANSGFSDMDGKERKINMMPSDSASGTSAPEAGALPGCATLRTVPGQGFPRVLGALWQELTSKKPEQNEHIGQTAPKLSRTDFGTFAARSRQGEQVAGSSPASSTTPDTYPDDEDDELTLLGIALDLAWMLLAVAAAGALVGFGVGAITGLALHWTIPGGVAAALLALCIPSGGEFR